MIIEINQLRLNYTIKGVGKPVIMLHGWGGSIKSLERIQDDLSMKYQAINMDLPGFGDSSPPPKSGWGSQEYAAFIRKFITANNIERPILLGHSNGGRICLRYALEYNDNVSGLILIDSAGIKNPLNLKKKLLRSAAKVAKPLKSSSDKFTLTRKLRKLAYRAIGETDYINSQDLTETYKKLITEDLSKDLSQIELETLILWGRKDSYTPIWMGDQMAKMIPHNTYKVYDDLGHGLPLYKPELVSQDILSWLNKINY